MSTLSSEERVIVKEKTRLGLTGLIYTYKNGRSWMSVIKKVAKWPILLSFGALLFIYFLLDEQGYLDFIIDLNQNILSIIPNLLGFLIGGYALFAGFGGKDLLKAMVSYSGSKYSNYQISSSAFGIAILVQLSVLAISFIVNQIINMNLVTQNYLLYKVIDLFTIYLLNFLMFLSISITRDIVVNIFNISQKYHLILFQDSRKEEAELPAQSAHKSESANKAESEVSVELHRMHRNRAVYIRHRAQRFHRVQRS
jgi:hypothetical protein